MYPLHFLSKLTDADGELQETSHWLASAQACKYLAQREQEDLQTRIDHVGKMPGKMISMPEKFARKK